MSTDTWSEWEKTTPTGPAGTVPDSGLVWNLTIKQAAAYLNVGRQTMYKMAREGRVPTRQVLGQWRFSEEWLRQWVDSGRAS